jgi:hypothetical protein
VRPRGSFGVIPGGRVNRDGIGAVVMFTPEDGKEVMRPIIAGASFASQDSLTADFGLGKADEGTVEILWPGGVRNRLYHVHSHERLVFPEIPVSFDAPGMGLEEYRLRVQQSLQDLVRAGSLSPEQYGRFLSSALRAFEESHESGSSGARAADSPAKSPASSLPTSDPISKDIFRAPLSPVAASSPDTAPDRPARKLVRKSFAPSLGSFLHSSTVTGNEDLSDFPNITADLNQFAGCPAFLLASISSLADT